MPSQRIQLVNTSLPHYLTFTVLHWYYVFDRHHRWQILSDALQFQINNRHLKVYAYVFMINHIHLIASSPDLIAFVRDFKKFTTFQIKKSIQTYEPHLLEILKGKKGNFQLWQKTNMPVVVEGQNILKQKLEYIANNPVKKEYVRSPENWYWSSLNPENPIPITPLV